MRMRACRNNEPHDEDYQLNTINQTILYDRRRTTEIFVAGNPRNGITQNADPGCTLL
jgi:hypothetical protein